ncbi:hypothetical protein [Shimia sp. SDUM112013]|uniref:hypothetical protein n=1 Tax=Shimia sp. SDUM112013 TaxID=3136160 RepID=UPI0032ECFAED
MTKLTRRVFLGSAATAAVLPAAAFAASVPAPASGMGLIVFYRGGAGAGINARFDIADANGKIVAHMQQGAVQPVSVTPGTHEFSVPDANDTSGEITVAAGQTVFVECYLDAATNSGKLQFRIQPEATAMKRISKM